ncbi:enoyl-CoA hydratase/isomerase family protein [Glacieibacterium frigidum]|uniref:3-hydroxyisobutyryl-CoA hydrolase n=1 Tax=Glacieibacterium frigidum TaxID=2593303 RepID=A0A552U7B9_9SPHN|nr:enoyl-CoA hydratase/isomerase family protein [Glacieibacterium frigidum]TRW14110.1 enoyl-CoA hydratase/isomerase family protein [Glacieibacterium frigidum]
MTAVRTERRGRALFVTLDRQTALNAIDRAMVLAIHRALMDGAADPEVDRIVIEGAGDRAFCAGGDVVGLHTAGRAGSDEWEGFFHDEYRMNQAVARLPVDYVALMDGVTMGGGVGLSVHGRYRVATERTLFAMPETGIGLIPDVGGTHALSALPGEIGTWLALTGARLRAADCRYAGIATHFVPAERLPLLRDLLADGEEEAGTILDTLDAPAGDSALAALREGIDFHFAHDRVEDIQASLAEGDDWARAQHEVIARMSPTSLKISLKGVRMARGGTIEAALRTEYRMVCAIKHGRDFYEGVRAQLIDKDRSPLWSPATLEEVDDAMVASYLREPPSGDLEFD